MDLVWKVKEGSTVKLKDYDPGFTNGYSDREAAKDDLKSLSQELSKLQELLAAAAHNSLLIILQGMDTSGKDGTIRHVFSSVNPQGCQVYSFKQPTPQELAHDFLWRVHRVTPPLGVMGIFNRSQYEDVLIVRVHNLVPETVWSRRYTEINHFESLLAHSNTIILKFFLHISKDEQEKRLEARENDIDKAWKISASDWTERKYWDAYQQAYEDLLTKCSADDAPWYIVPSNRKWYRNLAVAHTIVQTMRQYKDDWQKELVARGQQELALLRQMKLQNA